jgi:hypothetical protein
MTNINTEKYWDNRFETGNWEDKGGRMQTRHFANSFIKHINMDDQYSGHIVDYGCGLGDAIPIYQSRFPKAKFTGIDISKSAIDKCLFSYGNIANFIQGDYSVVPNADIIISSNVFEHISNYFELVEILKKKCRLLYVVVPFREVLTCNGEHINSFDILSFEEYGVLKKYIYLSPSWSQYGFKNLWWNVYFKNFIKLFVGKPLVRRNKQIMYEISGNLKLSNYADFDSKKQ